MSDENEKQQIIEAICERTRELMEEHWVKITSMREEQENRLKVSFAHLITYRGDDQVVKSTISTGIRFTDSVETTIESGTQMQLFEENGEEGSGTTIRKVVGLEGDLEYGSEDEPKVPPAATPRTQRKRAATVKRVHRKTPPQEPVSVAPPEAA